MQEKVKWKATFEFSDYTEEEIFKRFKDGGWFDGSPVRVVLEFKEKEDNQ